MEIASISNTPFAPAEQQGCSPALVSGAAAQPGAAAAAAGVQNAAERGHSWLLAARTPCLRPPLAGRRQPHKCTGASSQPTRSWVMPAAS